jgi:hypothetical protein
MSTTEALVDRIEPLADRIQYAGSVHDEEEIAAVVEGATADAFLAREAA